MITWDYFEILTNHMQTTETELPLALIFSLKN
jgi:hypothetical protein